MIIISAMFQEAKARRLAMAKTRSKSDKEQRTSSSIRIPPLLQLEKQVLKVLIGTTVKQDIELMNHEVKFLKIIDLNSAVKN